MSLLLAALRNRPVTVAEGLWLLPPATEAVEAQTLALALAAAHAAAVVRVPWAACTAGHWPKARPQRLVWWVPDAPPRPLTAAVRKRLSRLPARAIVVQGALSEPEDLDAHRGVVAQAVQAVAQWCADPDQPLSHLGIAALDVQRLGQFAETLGEFSELLDRTVAAALSGAAASESPQSTTWRDWSDQAVAELAIARFESLGPRAARPAVDLWLGSVRRLVDADDRTVRLLRRAGLLRADADALGWSAVARSLSQPSIGRVIRAARPDWPWHLAGMRDGVEATQARQVVVVFAGCALIAGMRPRSDGAIERLGVTALRQAIDQSFLRGDSTRRALSPWIDLTARLTTAAAAHWRTDDVQHLQSAETARQRLAEAATTANARFAVAALFDALHLFDACARPDAGEVKRTWTSLQWTLDRMGPTARPALAWLRLVVARSCVGQSSPAQFPYWAEELRAAEQELGTLQTFAPAVQRTQAWLAWSQGDSRGAQRLWASAGSQSGNTADTAGAIDSALDLAMSLLISGDPEAAVRIARPLAQRLTAERDRDRAPWATATWILAALCVTPTAEARSSEDPQAAQAHECWHAAAQHWGDGGDDDVLDLGGLVRCAALLAEGRSSEAQPLLAWAVKHAKKTRLPAFESAAQVGLGFCYLWAGDRATGGRLVAEALDRLPTPTADELAARGRALTQVAASVAAGTGPADG